MRHRWGASKSDKRPILGQWWASVSPDMGDEVLVSRVRRSFRTGEARRMREEAGLSIRELASLAKFPQASLQRWETGNSGPRAEACLAWAAAMKRLGFKV